MMPCHNKDTELVVHNNMRMGIGVTGYLQCTAEQKNWLSEGYSHLRSYDERYSAIKHFNPSIKLTTVKPSGTLSLLPGVLPGAHPGIARYMHRRITIASDHALVEVCKAHGYPVEYKENLDGTTDYGSVIVTFPYAYPDNAVIADEMTAIDQLNVMSELQTNWSDNSVSCTVYYRKEEIPAIREYLENNYKFKHKSLSFLLHSDHGFKQAPYEAVTKEEYERLVQSTRLITAIESAEFEGGDECAGGSCPVR